MQMPYTDEETGACPAAHHEYDLGFKHRSSWLQESGCQPLCSRQGLHLPYLCICLSRSSIRLRKCLWSCTFVNYLPCDPESHICDPGIYVVSRAPSLLSGEPEDEIESLRRGGHAHDGKRWQGGRVCFAHCRASKTLHLNIVQFRNLDIWVVSILGPLWIKLLWTFFYEYFCVHMYSHLLDVYLGIELLGHRLNYI